MKIVNSHNEWDKLEEIILGVPDFACIPLPKAAYRPKVLNNVPCM